jgi:hypothetical protein
LSIHQTQRVETVVAIQTASTTPVPTRPPTQTPTPEPTETTTPLPKNPVLISFIVDAGDGVDEMMACFRAYYTYRFVLYQDGHLILFDEKQNRYLETVIPKSEIDKLLNDIEATGFFSVNGNGDQYIPNAPTPSGAGGWGSSITVKVKTIGIDDSQSKYVVASVKKTSQLIGDLKRPNLKPYVPDSLEVWAISIQDTSFDNYSPTPQPPLLKWSSDAIQLNTLTGEYHPIFGNSVSFLIQQVKTIPAFRMVVQDGEYYLVLVCPNF